MIELNDMQKIEAVLESFNVPYVIINRGRILKTKDYRIRFNKDNEIENIEKPRTRKGFNL